MTTDLLGMAEIADRYGVSTQAVWGWSKKDTFPHPIAKLRMGKVWEADAVEAWVDRKRRAEALRV